MLRVERFSHLGGFFWGHSFSRYAQKGRGPSKCVRPAYKEGRWLTHGSTYAKMSLFARVLLDFHMLEAFTILCCLWRRLSLLFYKTFAMIIFLSFKLFTVYFFMELFIGYLKKFPLEIVVGGGG